MAAIEQGADKDGIVWPPPLTPFHCVIVPLTMSDSTGVETSEEIYSALDGEFDILLDDRDERAGSKFKDSDLIGVPLRVTVGERSLKKGLVELRERKSGKVSEFPVENSAVRIGEEIRKFFAYSGKDFT